MGPKRRWRVEKTCQYCSWIPGKIHDYGCPEYAREAWKRGHGDAVVGMSQAEPWSESYLLGHSRGQEDIKKAEEISIAGFEGIEFDEEFLDEVFGPNDGHC